MTILSRRTNGDLDQAEELAQETWTLLWAALSERRFDPQRSSISTYLYAIARNVWLKSIRNDQRELTAGLWIEGDHGEPINDSFNRKLDQHSDVSSDAEIIQAVRTALETDTILSPDERHALIVSTRAGSDRAAAKIIGIAPSTANDRKQLALNKIRTYLKRLGLAPESDERINR
jgi:RNA polymerase sigma-70 factor (ECF subfamily)